MTRIVNGIAPQQYGAATLFLQCRRAGMAKPKPEKKPAAAAPPTKRILPMELQLGDRIVDETGEYEVIGRPETRLARPRREREAAGCDGHSNLRRA